MEYIAHTNDFGQTQLLKDHLNGVAELCKQFAEAFGAKDLGYLAGVIHDLGKYSEEFQQRIRGSKIRVDHSTAGAQWITKPETIRRYIGSKGLDKHLANLIAHVVAGHHGGLKNHGTVDQEGTLANRLSKSDIKDYTNAWKELGIEQTKGINLKMFAPESIKVEQLAWRYSFLGRMLYSCLVDADTIDTRNFCIGKSLETEADDNRPLIDELLNRFDGYITSKLEMSAPTLINQKRRQILEACDRQAHLSPRMFSLSVPTGGGKTLSSLSFALRHAVEYGMKRIIYVIPFTSIVEQTAEQFRQAIGQDALLEHHSNFNYTEYEKNNGQDELNRLKLSTENWDAPVIVTTSVQFFESLFSNMRSKCRKLHNIANSVIIIDEAQSIPRGYMTPCLRVLKELIESYGCTAVLCTATQPSWVDLGYDVTEMMDIPGPSELMEAFKRVEVIIHNRNEEICSDEQVVDWLEESEQVLCIVNTRKHAKILFDLIKERSLPGIYHLSGRMCAKHRSAKLDDIRDSLIKGLPCRVVSTQLIEAGVDVDFPKVLRAMAGIDSIAQAAGRCNREGKLEFGQVYVFYPEQHGMPSKGWMKECAIEAQNVMRYVDDEPLSLPSIQNYFERIHGICDGNMEQVTDTQQMINLLKLKNYNLEIPYVDIAEKFTLIDGVMQTLVIPFDEDATELISQLSTCKYPNSIMRKLQPYTVQVYQHELQEFQRLKLLHNEAGVVYLIEKAFYSQEAGLLTVRDTPQYEVLIN